MPLNIYIQVTWKNSGKFNKFREEVEKRMNPEEIGGVKTLSGLLLPMPAKMVLGDQQVDLFTSAYSYHPQGLPFISPGAERLLKSAPRADAVAVIDIGGARSFVDSGLALTRELVPPNVMEQVEMVSNIESVVAYATFGRDLELKLDIESIGQTEAAELLEVAEQLIKLANPPWPNLHIPIRLRMNLSSLFRLIARKTIGTDGQVDWPNIGKVGTIARRRHHREQPAADIAQCAQLLRCQ